MPPRLEIDSVTPSVDDLLEDRVYVNLKLYFRPGLTSKELIKVVYEWAKKAELVMAVVD